MYTYTIKEIVKFIDGDTIDVIIDLGFSTYIKRRVRLYGIDTPETRTRDTREKQKGLAAKQRLQEICKESNYPIILKSYGYGKFGRVLGELFTNNTNINQQLVSENHAVLYEEKI